MLIGIDLGTTVLKVAAFAADTGALFAHEAIRLPVDVGDDGKREQCIADIDAAVSQALTALRTRTGKRWGDVRGIGLAAQGGSTIIADRNTGKAHTPTMILWNDNRAFPYLQRVMETHTPEFWRSFSLRDEPGIGLGRLLWLQEEHPALLQERNLYAGAGDYLYFHLTGQWRQDGSNALQTGCYDPRHNALTDIPLREFGIPVSFFSPPRQGHQTFPLTEKTAVRYGLPAGIPVAGPYSDQEAGFMAVMRSRARPLQCSLGTAWVGNFLLPEDTAGHSYYQLPLPSPTGEGRLVVQALSTGNVTWDWALATWADSDHQRALVRQDTIFAERLLPPYGLIAVPWLNRPHPFAAGVNGAACLLGLSPTTTNEDLLRAMALGMAAEFARIFTEVTARGEIDSLILSGGASKGEHFRQLFAALFHPLPISQVIEEDWMGVRGTLHAFNGPACAASTRPLALAPDIDIAAVRRGYELYLAILRTIYEPFGAGQEFTWK
ncbi:MAG: xylulokinase [Armatimonadota bacterium]